MAIMSEQWSGILCDHHDCRHHHHDRHEHHFRAMVWEVVWLLAPLATVCRTDRRGQGRRQVFFFTIIIVIIIHYHAHHFHNSPQIFFLRPSKGAEQHRLPSSSGTDGPTKTDEFSEKFQIANFFQNS